MGLFVDAFPTTLEWTEYSQRFKNDCCCNRITFCSESYSSHRTFTVGNDMRKSSTLDVTSALNDDERNSQKRSISLDDCDALDWHMRAYSTDDEKVNYQRRERQSSEVVERLAQRISWARKKRRLTDLQEKKELEQNAAMCWENSEVLTCPPCNGISWIGFTAPLYMQRLYITLRSTEQIKSRFSYDLKECESLNLGFTDKILNSGDCFEIPSVAFEEVKVEIPLKQDELWIEKYAPHSYADLMSEESVNRLLLNWIKLWDECVFQRKISDVILKGASYHHLSLNNEKPKCPLHKVVLLAGPAGAGKTTLVTVVAQHAGYRVINLNASDERNVTDFAKCFDDALRTTRTLDAGCRPNCLILDEIDGAPIQSIQFLRKAITATGRHSLRRPVICICNNLYTPSLREMRSVALVVHIERTDEKRLIKKLEEISKGECLKVETSALSELVNACALDIRSSINALQFIASGNLGSVSCKAVRKFCEREKQCGEYSLFDSWAFVFEISRHSDSTGRVQCVASRIRQIALLYEQHAGNDYFYMGLFSNYLNSKNAGLLINICLAIRQFCYFDRIIASISSSQDYDLMKYLFVVSSVIHLLLSCQGRVHLSFPYEHQNAIQRRQRNVEIAECFRARASYRSISLSTITMEILPHLFYIVQPFLKPMNTNLYSVREQTLLNWVVNVMCTYSLTYTPVLRDGSVSFVFEPAIDQLVVFDGEGCRSGLQTLSNIARQLIAHEVEVKKLRNMDIISNANASVLMNMRESEKITGGIRFCYSQGSSSAIRRSMKMKNLFLLS